MTKEIPLTKGKVAIVDDVDYEWLKQWRWFCTSAGYAARWDCSGGKQTLVLMHREIVRAREEEQIDHVNRLPLDNRRKNLRFATMRQNLINRIIPRRAEFRGVHRSSKGGRWRARIDSNGKKINLGTYDTAIEAAHAYDKAARIHHGEFAVLNFPEVQL